MIVRKAYKFRLKTNDGIEQQLRNFAGCCRFVWNKAWGINRQRLLNKQSILRYQELNFWTTLWKKTEEYGFLKTCHSQLLQQKLKDLDKTFMDAFDKTRPNKRFPRKKKRGLGDSFRFPQGFKFDNRRIYLPKLGWIRFYKSQAIEGTPKNVTVSYQGGHWYIAVQVEQCLSVQPMPSSRSMIGLDMGVKFFAMPSVGRAIVPKNSFRTHENKLKVAQRALSRKIKFSSNWKKQCKKIQRLHTRIAHVRHDFLHKCSSRLSKNHAIIVLEDLKVANMSKSAKGSLEDPGRSVKAKSGLNKSILDQGWGEFKRQLSYKLEWQGGQLVLINPKNTSRRCRQCGYTAKENRQTQERFQCVECGHSENADRHAARNIEAAGHAVLACGDLPKVSLMKAMIADVNLQAQEPLATSCG